MLQTKAVAIGRRIGETIGCLVAISLIGGGLTSESSAQVARFRMQTIDSTGTPVESVQVGDRFALQVFAEDLRAQASGGVFAGYMDVAFDENLASVAEAIQFGSFYQNGMHGDLSLPGLLDDIGAFSSHGEVVPGLEPIGIGENLLFEVPMKATSPGQLTFIGAPANNSPLYDVLVYNSNDVVNPFDIDFGGTGVAIDFGQIALRVQPVPEPASFILATLMGLATIRLARWRTRP